MSAKINQWLVLIDIYIILCLSVKLRTHHTTRMVGT